MNTTYNIPIRARLLLVVCIGCLFVSITQASQLFTYVNAPMLTDKQQHYADYWINSHYTESYTFVMVNVNAFTQTNIDLTLPDQTIISVRQNEIIQREGKRFSWKGLFNPFGNADFVINGDMVTARIANHKFIYTLYPLGGGLHILVKVSPIDFPDDETKDGYKDMIEQGYHAGDPNRQTPAVDPETGNPVENVLAGNCKVRILCAFTDDVQAALADPRSFVISAIDATNTSYSNSAVNFQVELARSVETSYAESGNSVTDKTRFRNTADGFMDEIHDVRTYYDADLCILIVSNLTNACGEAYTVAVSPYADAFCCVDQSCAVGNLSFPHELGHLYGCRHDRYVDATNTPYAYGHGHTSTPAGAFRTVMAYSDSCDNNGFSCPRVSQWSNPGVSFNGLPTGISGSRDNESALEASRSAVGGLETSLTDKFFPAETITADQIGDVLGINSVQNTNGAAYVLNSNVSMTWRAGSYHVLNPGFWGKAGCFFQTSFDNCTPLREAGTVHHVQSAFPAKGEVTIYPNPFTTKFELAFSNTAEGEINISLINSLGQHVRTLFRGHTATIGVQAFEFDLSDLNPGVYLCTLIDSAGNTITKRVTKMR